MISIKSEYEIELMKKAGHIVYLTHQCLLPYIKPGITTKELDKIAEDFIRSQGATPSFLNYNGFPPDQFVPQLMIKLSMVYQEIVN